MSDSLLQPAPLPLQIERGEQGLGRSALISDRDGQFASAYNRRSFQFEHGLKDHPALQLPALLELIQRMPDHRDTYWSNGRVGVKDGWEAGTTDRASLHDTLANIAETDSLVIIKHAEQDPVVGPVLQSFLAGVVDAAGRQMREDVAVGEVLILVSSPGRTTPYHFDGECNYVVQITGDKVLSVFNHADPTLVTKLEIERFHAGNISSAVYRAERQHEAVEYDLRAGTGVHVPLFAPHWVQNSDNVSITLSVTYELHSVIREALVHRVNHKLRRLGLDPMPPGRSAVRDFAKRILMRTAASAQTWRRGRARPIYPSWRPAAAPQ